MWGVGGCGSTVLTLISSHVYLVCLSLSCIVLYRGKYWSEVGGAEGIE